MLLFKNWYEWLLTEIDRSSRVNIVSPFIKEQVIRKVHGRTDFENFEIVTRFNLRDFATGVSSLPALRFAIESGAKVYGLRDLHSKIYLFDQRIGVISSANLTTGGLVHNHECGVCVSDRETLNQLANHFAYLKNSAKELTLEMCDKWQLQLDAVEPVNSIINGLPDEGAAITYYDNSKTYYVKFFGTGTNRVSLEHTVRDEVSSALCHYACGFPENKPPIQVNDGDVVYMARITDNPKDYAIFGRTIAVSYDPIRDRFTKREMREREWKRNWPIYLRVHSPTFIDATMADCPFLFDLIRVLDYASFPTLQAKFDDGKRGMNPKLSLARQAYVRLTDQAVEWLEPKFQDALTTYGSITNNFLNNLSQPPTSI